MSKFKVGDKVIVVAGDYSETCWDSDHYGEFIGKEGSITREHFDDYQKGREYVVDEISWVLPEECLELITKKHTYTGEWISIDEELPPFGVEVYLFLPEEKLKRQKGYLKYIGAEGNVFISSYQANPFATLANYARIKGEVKMWTLAPPLPQVVS